MKSIRRWNRRYNYGSVIVLKVVQWVFFRVACCWPYCQSFCWHVGFIIFFCILSISLCRRFVISLCLSHNVYPIIAFVSLFQLFLELILFLMFRLLSLPHGSWFVVYMFERFWSCFMHWCVYFSKLNVFVCPDIAVALFVCLHTSSSWNLVLVTLHHRYAHHMTIYS